MSNEILYVGKDKVEQVNVVESLNLVSVLYESGRTEDLTLSQWDALKSLEPYDTGMVSIRKYGECIEKIYNLLLDNHADINSHGWILERVTEKVGNNYRGALAKLFNEIDPRVIPLIKIDEIIKPKE